MRPVQLVLAAAARGGARPGPSDRLRAPRRGLGRSLPAPRPLLPPPPTRVHDPGSETPRLEPTRQHAASTHREAPRVRQIELEPHRAVEARRDHVEGVFDECAIDRRPAAVPRVDADARAEVHGDPMPLRKYELEIDVADDVAERDPSEIDAVRLGRIHDAIEPPLEPVAGRLIEFRMKVGKAEEQPDARRDAPVVDPHSSHSRADELGRAEDPGIELNAGEAEILVGELVEDTLRG